MATTRDDPTRPKSNTDHDFPGMSKKEEMVMHLAAALISRDSTIPLNKIADLAVKYVDELFDRLEGV